MAQSYCCIENASEEMREVLEKMYAFEDCIKSGRRDEHEVNKYEAKAYPHLISLCYELIALHEKLEVGGDVDFSGGIED